MEIKEFIENFAHKTKENIAKLAETKLTGAEKKAKLDEKMTKWAEELLNSAKINIVLKQAVKQFVIKNIPVITQVIFDLLKSRIKGITETSSAEAEFISDDEIPF